ncbi:hypothetical protein A3860_02420 [Niastella vici]|uniref:HEPN AbiJ-N-terminal domain-containing protein n=1 Tax=Niastella vici TaxID=1703345 RepID=A0A1V9G9L9_9BACT|nr:hypothetical protein [Niastella vici]OQP67234.1 hypothetical protein A3860_02420 [Niastella vici]
MTANKNNLSFGKRYGFEPVEVPFQVDSISTDLRTELWNAIYLFILQPLHDAQSYSEDGYRTIRRIIWVHYLIKPLDDFPRDYEFDDVVKQYIEKSVWYKVYEFFEFVLRQFDENEGRYSYNDFIQYINGKLRQHNSAYTIISNKFVQITNSTEIAEINSTGSLAKEHHIIGIQEHLKAAIDLFSKKPNPDYRNSIKESISMVEVISRIIEPENTLGKALNKLEKSGFLNPVLKAGFEKLYAYTNDKNGIRHALLEEKNIDTSDARFFLVSCSAFTNYLIEKARSANLLRKI